MLIPYDQDFQLRKTSLSPSSMVKRELGFLHLLLGRARTRSGRAKKIGEALFKSQRRLFRN